MSRENKKGVECLYDGEIWLDKMIECVYKKKVLDIWQFMMISILLIVIINTYFFIYYNILLL